MKMSTRAVATAALASTAVAIAAGTATAAPAAPQPSAPAANFNTLSTDILPGVHYTSNMTDRSVVITTGIWHRDQPGRSIPGAGHHG